MHSHGAAASEHDAPAPGTPAAAARRRLRRLLAAILVPLVVLTGVALVLLLPGDDRVERFPSGLGPQTDLVRAELLSRQVVPCPDRASEGGEELVPILPPPSGAPGVGQTECIAAEVQLLSGPDEGTRFVLDALSTPVTPFPETGLGLSLLVVTLFVLPALLAGSNALLVALVGSAAVMFTVLYLAHGVRVQTSIAVLGTLASLLLTVVLAEVFVRASSLTGLGSDETGLISATVGTVDLRGLLLAGIVIGSLGVLDDVTVTQSSAVWELHLANPAASARELYRSGIRIGRDHIASTVNTLVLAYVGASLPLLVVYSLAGSQLQDVLTSEVVAQEVVRTLVGSIGLVAAVPLTTMLAALTVRVDRPG